MRLEEPHWRQFDIGHLADDTDVAFAAERWPDVEWCVPPGDSTDPWPVSLAPGGAWAADLYGKLKPT